ncbi:hypothetical protein BU16DRAFT_119715 [Lophium mytilinum]|uniref:Uncharacterized protein n=1 Tax=Lophium mytilinum TaxID=390894 RepID=A0A6A6QGX4_9PEZI|nr:hypothetical protein BU16DRAFT_119715 [Lophium mytilinum]
MLLDQYENYEHLQHEFKDLLAIFEFRNAANRILAQSSDYSDWQAQCMLVAIRQRLTSREDDEAICIGSFLGFNVSVVLEAEPGDRMKALLPLFPTVPPNIMFGIGKRIAEQGFRWAPKTLLYPKGVASNTLDREMQPKYATIKMHKSLYTDAGALERKLEAIQRPDSYLHPEGLGLVTFFPSIQLMGGEELIQHFILRIEPTMDRFSVSFEYGIDAPSPSISFDRLSILHTGEVVDMNSLVGLRGNLLEQTGEQIEDRTAARYIGWVFSTPLAGNEVRDHGTPVVTGIPLEAKWWLVD